MTAPAAKSTSKVRFPSHSWVAEPDLLFHPERPNDKGPHPLKGLLNFGPYSRAIVNAVIDPIRVAIIAPAGEAGVADKLIAECMSSQTPRERKNYLPPFPGVERVFGVRLVAPAATRIELPRSVDSEISQAAIPHVVLAEHLARALNRLAAMRHEFDVLTIYLPERWSPAFYGPEGDDFDLHAFVKSTAASQNVPTQLLREDKVVRYPCRCSVAWRLTIALYVKAGGTPWRLADIEKETAFIGLSYKLRTSADRKRFVTCCSQVFDADGTAFEFLVYSTEDFTVDGDNPFLTRPEMHRVMARCLDLYQRRHAGRSPRRIVVHKTTEFKIDEVDGCFDAFHVCEEVDLLHVQQDSAWKGVNIEQPQGTGRRGSPGLYPVLRGTYVPLSGREILLWTQGDAPSAVGGQHYFKEGKGIPSPLLVRRHAGHGGWDTSCRHLLALTKMDWNNDALYSRLPVTISYARELADVVRRLPHFSSQPYQSRFFM